MKNSADRGEEVVIDVDIHNTLRDMQNSSYPAKAEYYSFKITASLRTS